MKFLTFAIAVLLLTPMVVSAETTYKVKGDNEAMQVCRAVLANDTARLDQVLENYHRNNKLLSHYLDEHDPAVLKDFSCNDMSLYDFALKVGSNDINRYITGYMQGEPRVYVEDVAEQSESDEDSVYF